MRKDFEKYLTQLQLQYNDMVKTMEKVNKQIEDGMLTPESTQGLQSYFDIINVNYQRVLYCRYLYKLPPKFIQNITKKKMEKQAEKFIKEHADKDSVVAESQEALDKIKEEVVDEDSGNQSI